MPRDASGEESIVVDRRGDVLALRLNRPARLNAFSRDMYVLLDELVTEAAADPTLRVIVITGTGRGFSTGGDLKQHLERRERGEDHDPVGYIKPSNHAFETLLACDKVVVAAVNGPAYAAGLIVTLCADIVIASERATFCVPEGLTGRAEPWTARLLPSRVGRTTAGWMTLTAEPIDAPTALAAGLVNRVVAHDELTAATEQAVTAVLRSSPQALSFYRRLLNEAGPTRFDLESIHTTIFSADTREGTEAFVARRPPAWTASWSCPSAWRGGAGEN